MKCHVKVELLDSENNVTKSTETDGIITNAYKYLSTWGFPGVARNETVWNNCFNADLTFGGVIGFKLSLPEGEDDFRYNLSNLKTCYATRYSADYSAISDKIGTKMPDLCEFTSTSYKQVWEWGESQGNGVISSVCLTHAAGAGAFDVTPPKDKTVVYAMGNDGAGYIYPLATQSLKGTAPMQKNTTNAYCPFLRGYPNGWAWGGDWLYYQTDKYIIMLYASVKNEQQEAGGYKTVLKYRRIEKAQMYRWNGFLHYTSSSNAVAHKMSAPSLGTNDFYKNSWDGELTINTPYALSSYGRDTSEWSGFNKNFRWSWCEDDFAIAFRMALPFPSDPDDPDQPADFRLNPDRVDKGMKYTMARRVGTILISGDTPTIITPSGYQYFDSEYNSPLDDWHSGGIYTAGIMFMKDLTYIYKWQPANNATTNPSYNKLVRRKLDGDVLVWEKSLGADSNNQQPISPCYFLDSEYFICPDWRAYTGTSSSTSTIYNSGISATIRKTSDGSIAGYTELGPADASRPITSLKPLDKNMFFLDYNVPISTAWGFNSYLNTNYMYAKFNLSTAITKTSSSKLRITATVEL